MRSMMRGKAHAPCSGLAPSTAWRSPSPAARVRIYSPSRRFAFPPTIFAAVGVVEAPLT